MSSTKGVVLTNTDRVQRGLPRRKTEMSELTDPTALSSISDDQLPASKNKSSRQSELLMKVIAREMVATMMKQQATAADDISKCSDGESLGENSMKLDLNLDIEAIADMVIASVENQKGGTPQSSDRSLRNMLREGLNIIPATTEEEEPQDYYEDEEQPADCGRSSAGFSKAASMRTTSTISDLSMRTGGMDEAPVDIWHPDFWADLDGVGGEDVPNDSCTADPTLPSKESSMISSDEDRSSACKSLHNYLMNRNNEISSSDSEEDEDDDRSVMSDLTGLTGCFEDFSEERKKEKAQAKKDALTASTTMSRVSTDRGSIVGSYVGSACSSQRRKKDRAVTFSVSFGEVKVRQYERIMCDNPACTTGPSIGIGWNYVEKDPVSVEERETARRRRQKKGSELILNRAKREKLIRSLGYGDKDIAATVRELNKIRYLRRQTVNNLGAQKMEEAVENAKRQVKKMLFLKRSTKGPIMDRPERVAI